VLLSAGCGEQEQRAATLPSHAPRGTLTIALAEANRWPFDPLQARTRDERQLVRILLATPLRLGADDQVQPGLCTTWTGRAGRSWTFTCSHASEIATRLRQVVPDARVSVQGRELHVRLPFAWLRFPYMLTSARLAVPGTRGPFRIVRRGSSVVQARRGELTLELRLNALPQLAAQQFRDGLLDEAPVTLGDIRAAQLDPLVGPHVRVTRLLAVDALVFDINRGSLTGLENTRRTYWHTAARGDYQDLVPEREARASVSLLPGYGPNRAPARAFRAARARIRSLPPVAVGVATAPELDYSRDLLVAVWRDVGLLPRAGGSDAVFRRLAAAYPQEEALLAQVVLPLGKGLPGQGPFLDALGRVDQRAALERADDRLFAKAVVVPVAWAVDARLVSPRVRGWRADRLGEVDYTKVTLRSRG
jgi:hypothetical protein